MSGLTAKQSQLLECIDHFIEESGHSPSYAEMAQMIGLASKSGIYRLVMALKDRGFLSSLPYRRRTIEVRRLASERAPTLPVKSELEQLPTLRLTKLMLAVQSELDRRAAA